MLNDLNLEASAKIQEADDAVAEKKSEETLNRGVVRGAQWILIFSVFSALLGYGVNITLGRIGPEFLGFYGFVTLTGSIISTFFLFGGANVAINFLPRLESDRQRDFIVTYFLLIFTIGIILLGLCVFFPALLKLMYGMNVVPSALLYVSLLFLIIVCQTLVWSILQSFLKLRAYAVSLYCVSFFNLIFLSAFLFLHYLGVDARSQNERMIFISVFLANLISLAIGIYCVLKDLGGRWSGRAKLWLPSGFWKFTSTLHINSLTLFFLMNTDQLVVLRYLGIKELGYYRVVLVLSSLVIWVPIVMDKVYYATFCNLTSDTARTEDAFLRFSRINILACSLVFIVIILFAAELTSLFGKSSLDANLPVLILLCGAKLLTVPINMLNLALLTAHQKTFHTMIYYAIGALLSLYLFGAIVAAYGLLGAAIAYCIVQAVIFAVSLLLMKILLRVRFPVKKYLFSIATVAMASAAGLRFHAMGMENTGIKLCIVAAFFGLTMALGLISIDDLRELIDWFVPSFVGRFLSRSKPS